MLFGDFDVCKAAVNNLDMPDLLSMNLSTAQQNLWSVLRADLQQLFAGSQDVYKTWLEPISCISQQEDALVLGVPSEFALIWVEEHYLSLLRERLQLAVGHPVGVSLQVDERREEALTCAPAPVAVAAPARVPMPARVEPVPAVDSAQIARELCIKPTNTFENFVVGQGNESAHAACIAVATNPGQTYNPLFLYGDTGLGKTHLMHAVAHCVLKNRPGAHVAYVTTENFTNEYISALQTGTLTQFRKRYRNVDVLLIDDVQFLSGKEGIQQEFFHTFNQLFDAHKQIVLSSDRSASEIAKLEDRLLSRFQWGLNMDIQPPDRETRIAILAHKAAALRLNLPREIIAFMAERVSRNVRRLEGALSRVALHVAITQKPITDIADVERLLHDILQEEVQTQMTVETIQQKVVTHYHLRMADMVSRRRPANIALPRQIAMYLSRVLTAHSLQEIGEGFGGRDHGTVIHACKTVENLMETDESVRRTVELLRNQLGRAHA